MYSISKNVTDNKGFVTDLGVIDTSENCLNRLVREVDNDMEQVNVSLSRGTGWAEIVYSDKSYFIGSSKGSQKPVDRSGGLPKGGSLTSSAGNLSHEEQADKDKDNRARSVRRAKAGLRRNSKNFFHNNNGQVRFLTLTFADNVTDRDKALQYFKRFKRRLDRYFPELYNEFQYIAVMERQERGAWHFHLLVNIYLPAEVWSKLWGVGFIKVNKCRSLKHSVCYMAKYMDKAFNDVNEKGKNRYLCSQGVRVGMVKEYFKVDSLDRLNELIEKMGYKIEFEFAGNSDYGLFMFYSCAG